MFWWRKRNEGFEWRDYVRTTILVRREQRRQKLKDIQAAAASHVKDAGRRGLDASVAGARAGGIGAWSGLKTAAAAFASMLTTAARATGPLIANAASALARGLVALIAGAAALVSRASAPLMPALEPVVSRARQPRTALVLKVVAVLAGLGAAYRIWAFGFDGDAKVAAAIAALSLIVIALAFVTDPDRAARRRVDGKESLLARLHASEVTLPGSWPLSAASAGLAVLALFVIAGLAAAVIQFAPTGAVSPRVASAPATTAALPDIDNPRRQGRATAVTGDTLRMAGSLLVLDGIEAPEPGQVCTRKSGRWRCGSAAKDALARLVRGRQTACDIVGETETGLQRARCYVGDDDVAEKLVRSGAVFSTGGFFAPYSGVESEAAAEKLGLWSGEAERPQDYRDKRWQEAQRKAPEGCPIKGRVRSGARTYVLPWSPSYDSIKLSKSRGERWFCSESEAQAAGWRPGSPS